MAQFRKRPVVIEAVRWGDDCTFGGELPTWLRESIDSGPKIGGLMRMGDTVHVFTLEGVMVANPGDWIIRGVKHELYPCKPDIFAATYEPVVTPNVVHMPDSSEG